MDKEINQYEIQFLCNVLMGGNRLSHTRCNESRVWLLYPLRNQFHEVLYTVTTVELTYTKLYFMSIMTTTDVLVLRLVVGEAVECMLSQLNSHIERHVHRLIYSINVYIPLI